MNLRHRVKTTPSGLFSLPALDERIPGVIKRGAATSTTVQIAIQAGVRHGVPLPKGGFGNLEQVLCAQWTQFIGALLADECRVLTGTPAFFMQDHGFGIRMMSEPILPCLRMKPVIESLEAEKPGLGWFVWDVITQASFNDGLRIYEPSFMADTLFDYMYEIDELSDKAYLQWCSDLYGDGRNIVQLSESDQAKLFDEAGRPRPSEIIALVGGHLHLLGHGLNKGHKPPPMLTLDEARLWLEQCSSTSNAAICQTVRDAVALKEAMDWDKPRAFLSHRIPDPNNDMGDDLELIGACAALCWDEPHMLYEAIEHYEVCAQQAGEEFPAYSQCYVPTDKNPDASIDDLIVTFKAQLKTFQHLNRLLGHFPAWEGDQP